jgi:hypothetical protein
MSRRTTREGRRLAEDVARVIDRTSPVLDRRMSRAQALKIKQEDARLLEERRENSMRRLLRKQYMPWIVGGVVFVFGAATWLMRWLSDDPLLPVTAAALAGLILAWTAWMMGRRIPKWRGRIHLAAAVASVWLLYAAATGPSWKAPLLLVVGTVLSSSSWWKANRPPHPTAPSRGAVPVPADLSVPALWAENLGGQGRIFQGSLLSGYDDEDPKDGCESHRLNLVPGKQTITGVLSQLELIAGGLLTPVERVILEPDPDRSPIHVKLTIVEHSPIEDTVPYRGARITGDHRHLIEVGPYGDGDGYATWRMWAPGEKPMTGSWLSGLVIGGTGSGKSRLVELLAAGYMASGCAIPWFNDPQGGASSPALQEYADWYTSSAGTAKMIAALERAAEAREKENSAMKWSRFDPSPERPGIVAFFDEGHVAIARYMDRLEALARKTQKVGIAIIVLTHGAGLDSLGKDILRASLMANVIVMRTGSNQTKNLLPGLPVNPEMLPKIPGFGYSVGVDGARTAPFRSEYQKEPEYWYKLYAELVPPMDTLTANAIGEDYQLRREVAVEEQDQNRQWVEEMRSGSLPTQADEPGLDDWGPGEQQPAAFQVVRFPSAVVPPEKSGRERVLVAVAKGITRTAEIRDEVRLSNSQVAAILKSLLESNELEQPTRGVYAIAGSATSPER